MVVNFLIIVANETLSRPLTPVSAVFPYSALMIVTVYSYRNICKTKASLTRVIKKFIPTFIL